ncbi:MAG: class I lanthipeptide [Candidatus Sulfotelmatobacter sp.]
MKKIKKLELKKVTLRNLDEPILDAVAGGITGVTCFISVCNGTCFRTCETCGGGTSCGPAC